MDLMSTEEKKLEAQPVECNHLKNLAEILLSLCSRPVMKSNAAWEIAYTDIKSLRESFISYHDFFISQKEKFEKNPKTASSSKAGV